MKKVILALAAVTSLAATAATARLGSAIISGGDVSDVTIDVRRGLPAVDNVTLAVKGGAVTFGEVVVVYRTGDGNGPYKATKFRVNTVVRNGGAFC